jgi:putative aldouronate transport system substrate-binding protein
MNGGISMKKRMLAITAMLLALAALTSCASSGQPQAAASPQISNTADSPKIEASATPQSNSDEPITFTMFSDDPQQKEYGFTGRVARKITEKTGVTLEIEVLNGMDQSQKRSVMIAGGDFPDLLTNVGNDWTDGGALIELDELIEQYAPNIKEKFGDSLKKLRYEQDGKIHFVAGPANKPADIIDANQCLLIQYDVLDKLGYPKLETLDDVSAALKSYLEIVPDLDGKSFTPWGLWLDTWGYNITMNNPALWVNGFLDDSDANVNPETYEVTFFNRTDYFKKYLKWLNVMYNENMIDPNSFIMKNEQMKSLASTGRILAMIDGTWDIGDVEASLRQAGMPERCYARLPIVIEKGVVDRSQVTCESYSWGVGISPNCKDPVRAIKFLDWVASDEGSIMLNWGVEGIHYDTVDGKRALKPEIAEEINKDPDFKWREGYQYIWNQQVGAVKLDDGDYAVPFNPDSVYPNSDDWTRKVMDQFGIKFWGQNFKVDGNPNPFGYTWSLNIPQGSPGQVAASKADQIRHQLVPTIVSAASETEFEAKWQEFINSLLNDSKIEEYEKAMTDLIRTRMELWK